MGKAGVGVIVTIVSVGKVVLVIIGVGTSVLSGETTEGVNKDVDVSFSRSRVAVVIDRAREGIMLASSIINIATIREEKIRNINLVLCFIFLAIGWRFVSSIMLRSVYFNFGDRMSGDENLILTHHLHGN